VNQVTGAVCYFCLRVKIAIIAAVAASCTMSCVPRDKAPEEAAQGRETSPGDAQGSLSPCEESAVARLESYVDLQLPATRRVEMVSDGGDWRPADHIAMPHHHASRLELANVADFPALAARGGRVRFTVEIMSREIHQVPGRREWRATYFARIIDVCVPG
jgi:hypothetical protein